jgi:hypothetical protein|tara:strand:- start:188 stop:1189 length:1002 start_codon:yes stop_codon:yes gene_type:complete
MAFQKVTYEFPDESTPSPDIDIEGSSAVEVDLSGKPAADKEKVDAAEYDIEVVDDTPKADRGRKISEPPADVTDEELEEYSDKVRNRIKHFSKGYHDERRSKEQALRERQELETFAQRLVDENKELKGTVGKNQTAMLDQAKRSATNELETAKTAYKEAYEAGDSDAVVTAQESLTSAKIRSDRLNNFKLPALQEDVSPVPVDAESTPAVDPRAVEWARVNSDWFGPDDEMTSFAMGVHNKLVKSGVDPNGDEYYEKLDSRMQTMFPESFSGAEEVLHAKPKRQSNVVAPATRSTAPKKITLTQTQVNIANRLSVPLKLYAEKVAEEMRKANG